ncbi:transposase [Methylobacter luteus]|uniref:transposase n=1 Tax=Methylobacter luteus TaxID=415 RepID=UPI00041067D1|nr:transposase [Methylobacter luteus]
MCKELALFGGEEVAVDGSFFKANANKAGIYTEDKLNKQLAYLDKKIADYNAQIAVDGKHKLIIAEAVTQDGNDAHQLVPMLEKAQYILQSADLTGFTDRGYYEGSQLMACEAQNMTVYATIPGTSKATSGPSRFTREQFKYPAEQDCYVCP